MCEWGEQAVPGRPSSCLPSTGRESDLLRRGVKQLTLTWKDAEGQKGTFYRVSYTESGSTPASLRLSLCQLPRPQPHSFLSPWPGVATELSTDPATEEAEIP